MKLTDYVPSVRRKVLVYGPPKSGKTELVGSLAAHGYHLWWFDLDAGVKTLLRPDSAAKGHLENIELFNIPDTQTFPIGIETLLKVTKGGQLKICHRDGRVNCASCTKNFPNGFTSINTETFTDRDILVTDSVSQLAASAMNHICREHIAKGNDDYKPDWDDYRKQGFLMDRIFSIVQQCNFNVICISHEQMVEMEDKKKRLVPIGGTSNFSKTFAKYFDDVIYTEFINGRYRAYSDASQNSSAIIGSRTGKKLTEGKGLIELFQ
jgi:hypothetical protein